MQTPEKQDLEVAIENALKKIFGDSVDSTKFINASRIPLICQDIANIKKDIGWIKSVIMGVASALLLALLAIVVWALLHVQVP